VPGTLWQLVLHREQLVVDGYGHTVLVVLLLPLSHCSPPAAWTMPSPQYCAVPGTLWQLVLHREQLVVDG
jgi:hypothetical protein